MTTIKVDIIFKKKKKTPYIYIYIRGKKSKRNFDGSDITILNILHMHFTIKHKTIICNSIAKKGETYLNNI
jgi:hypothetical protein